MNFVPGWRPGGGIIQPPFVVFTDEGNDGSNDDEYSFASLSLGDEHPSRHIYCLFWGSTFLGVPPFTAPQTCTIAGVSATAIINPAQDARQMWAAAVPTGTTGTITWGSAAGHDMIFGSVQVWAGYHLKNPLTPTDTALGSGNPTASDTIDVLQNGVIIARAAQTGTTGTALPGTWTGAIFDDSGTVGGGTGGNDDYSGASQEEIAAVTGRTLSFQAGRAGATQLWGASFR